MSNENRRVMSDAQEMTASARRRVEADTDERTHQGFFDISEHGWKWWFVASMNGVMIGSFIKFTVLTYFWLDDTLGELS